MKKTMFWLAAAALALGLVFAGCSLFDWLSGDEDEPEEAAGIVYSFDPKAEGMEPWQVVISLDEAYFRLPDIERPGYRLYWHNLETGAYIPPGKRLLFSSPLWTRNCRFEAEWERLIYIIAYHEGGGQSAPGNPFRYTVESEDIHLFPLTKAGWIFGGWYDNAACTGEPVTVIPKGSTGYKELWAKWVEVPTINLSSPPASGTTSAGWDYANSVYTIHNGTEVRVTGTTTTDRLVVNGTATITLDGASIVLSSGSASPLGLASGANLTLRLSGENTLTASGGGAGVHAPDGRTLKITSAAGDGQTSGTLTATGGGTNGAGAGIGGSMSEAGGTITLAGGTITATGGNVPSGMDWGGAAGIGGGGERDEPDGGNTGTITISGGKVYAYGGSYGAGIGGGYLRDGGNITLSSGTVNTAGGNMAAGIGGGCWGAGGNITISGGEVTSTSGQNAAGIGGGYESAGGAITISGSAVVNATGDQGGAGIGGGCYGAGGTVRITGGSGTATAIGNNWDANAVGPGHQASGGLFNGGAFPSDNPYEW